ncbi:hypothetical protein P7G44_12990, partial [Enterococcus faecalis]
VIFPPVCFLIFYTPYLFCLVKCSLFNKNETCVRGSMCGFPIKTADGPILKNNIAQENMNEKRKVTINDIGRNIVYLRNLSNGK